MQFEELKELIAIFEKSDMNNMKVRLDNASIHLSKEKCQPILVNESENVLAARKTTVSENATVPAEEEMPKPEENTHISDEKCIKSPIVGTFYQAASPEKPPYVNVGDKVKKGDIVCIIEAMKFMNEVTSKHDGEILEVLVKDGEFVEFGAPLFKLK